MADIEYIRKTLQAVADGYDYSIEDVKDLAYENEVIDPSDHVNTVFFLVVENPDFKEDDGSDPNLCIMIDKVQIV